MPAGKTTHVSRRGLLATPALLLPASGEAQDYPARPVRIIVPNPPGGSSDIVARIFAQELSDRLGVPFVIENRGGAGGNIGTEAIARAAPDGYTIGVGTITQWATNVFMYRSIPIEPLRDLTFISASWENVNVLAVPRRTVPARTIPELVAYGRGKPNGLYYSSSGVGFTSHLLGELLGQRLGVRVNHVPFRGGTDSIASMLRGEIDFSIDGLATLRGAIDGGDLHVMAITDAERSPLAPEIPTFAELGLPDFTCIIWAGFIGPAGLPRPVTDRLSQALQELAGKDELRQRLLRAGAKLIGSSPDAMRARVERERGYWRELVRLSGAQFD